MTHSGEELVLREFSIQRAVREQGAVGALRHHGAGVEDDNQVGVDHGSQPVRDEVPATA